jgi:membrane protein
VTPGSNRREEELARLAGKIAADEDAVEKRAAKVLAGHPRDSRVIQLLRAVMREQTQEQVGLAASGAAFWMIISAFPTAIAAVSIFGLVVTPAHVAKDLSGLADAGPSSLGAFVTEQLKRVAAGDHRGLSTELAISLVVALWSASAGIYNLERAIRAAYGLRPEEYVDARKRAFVGAFATVIALGVLALLSAAVSGVIKHVPMLVTTAIGIPVLLVFMTSAIAGWYRFSIDHRAGLRALLPGAVTSAFGLAFVAVGFTIYVHFSTRFTAVYGALAGAVIAMIGTYLAVYVVLLGAVLNVQLSGTVTGEWPS